MIWYLPRSRREEIFGCFSSAMARCFSRIKTNWRRRLGTYICMLLLKLQGEIIAIWIEFNNFHQESALYRIVLIVCEVLALKWFLSFSFQLSRKKLTFLDIYEVVLNFKVHLLRNFRFWKLKTTMPCFIAWIIQS